MAHALRGLRTSPAGASRRVALLLEDRVDHADITAERIAVQPLDLLCAPGHRLADRTRPGAWEELATEDFFLHEQGCSYSDWLADQLQAVPGTHPRMTRFGSIEAAVRTERVGQQGAPRRPGQKKCRWARELGEPFTEPTRVAGAPVRLSKLRGRASVVEGERVPYAYAQRPDAGS
ncbi:LysR substrate-binding domain-containing protein [Streptomyces sp. NBC_01171]|uniref:LysR substrate-binding domain-containing protein n=1 Tax=Streptomyces sp. NBC_01171 TaxID=2903757 RepID=UPI00386C183C|nr:substrate-binding domain-containing protein [Streptomyces sp. NBC_01171]